MEFNLIPEEEFEEKYNKTLKEGDLRVWWNTNGRIRFAKVSGANEAKEIINLMTKREVDNNDVVFNAQGMEVYEDYGEGICWSEYYDKEGRDILEMMEEEFLEDEKDGS